MRVITWIRAVKKTETITFKAGENKVVFFYSKNIDAIPELETGEHIKYINGYPDGSVKPGSSITRAEAAAIYFRLIKDENKNIAVNGTFSDVGGDTWYAQSVNYLASQGILVGYRDGTFKPRQTITRAEFAAIASRFDNLLTNENTSFKDVSIDHWAAAYIDSAYTKGWINGYPDGSFRPASSITRAEVVKIINNMLNRKIELSDIPSDAVQYKDLTKKTLGVLLHHRSVYRA
ncbi:S-layer homology domain-containing protein [Lysinibacillus sp. MHQ-1]|nr:S-layer homology domain-containing protein [Lysinibacillus sp. MHQ-1]